MKILLENISKRYKFEWIFRNISTEFEKGTACAILGSNGSGKSTFLKILSGHLTPSKGKIKFENQGQKIEIDDVYKEIAFCAPYIDLIEEFTLVEAIEFHQNFKPLLNNLSAKELIGILDFSKSKNKEIRHFSSGMKQRLKLILAICSDTPALFLDEPTTNLDTQGIDWYQELIEKFRKDRLIIVASNMEIDYQFCDRFLNILDFKQ
ncbi:MAG: ABC transporter ATP-binding protein [Bacteroidetes bacterium]|jgi:ABC-type multidrug transport system ATPase subunit|nr:ABC transporter ATP-binding protein [Bacteroidota bacterium]